MEQKNLFKEFLSKAEDCGYWTNFWKLARRHDEVAALKAYRIFVFFYSVIFIHKLDIIRKKCHSFVNFLRCNTTKYYFLKRSAFWSS